MEYEYQVTLSPENNKKWDEMLEDKEAKEILLKIYQDLTNSALVHGNNTIENLYASYKEGRLQEHYKFYLAMQEKNFLEQLKNML